MLLTLVSAPRAKSRHLLWILAVLAALPAAAQRLEGAALRLTLREAVARAAEVAPRVGVASAQVREAEASRAGAGVWMPENPWLWGQARPGIGGGTGGVPGYAAQLEMKVEVSNAAGARIAEAEGRAGVARADLRGAALEARAAAWEAYVEALAAELRVQQLDAALELVNRVRAASLQRIAVGAASDTELTLVDLQLAEARAAREVASAAQEAAVMALRATLDLPADQPVELTDRLDTLPGAPPLDRLVVEAFEHRPELAALEARVSLLDTRADRLIRELIPRLGFHAGVDAAPASPVFGMVGMSVELPVAQRNQGPRAVTARERETERLRLELARRQLERDVRTAYRWMVARIRAFDALAQQGLPAAERNVELVEMGWRAGRFDIFRLTSATRDLLTMRERWLGALTAAWDARITLARTTGVVAP